MKIKHFAGYGSVKATKISKKSFKNEYNEPMTQLKVKVEGNHEWGLERNDGYDLYNWLVTKFDKKVGEYGLNVEVCEYTFEYKA